MVVLDLVYKCECVCPQLPSFSIAKCVRVPGVCMYTDRVHLVVKIDNRGPVPADHQHPWLQHTKIFHWPSIDGVTSFSRFAKVVSITEGCRVCKMVRILAPLFWLVAAATISWRNHSLAHVVVMWREKD